MASELIATGTTLANSADIVLADGETANVFLKDAAGPSVSGDVSVKIQIKDSAGQYFNVGSLTRREAAKTIYGPGTFRISRPVCTTAVGVEQG